MSSKEVKRKLTAVLSADVQGFSRLMGEDEEGTHERLGIYRDVIETLAHLHHGRVVTIAGDGFLIEFASVVDALACAVEMQREFLARNESLPEDRQMKFRVGINVGDVIEEDDQIFGDGVNIAARLQTLAEGGGICLSGQAYDHVKKRMAFPYYFLGEKRVKNINEPVRVYRVDFDEDAAFFSRAPSSARRNMGRPYLLVAAAIAVAIMVGAVAWFFRTGSSPPPRPQAAPTSLSIAVKPFKPAGKENAEEERLSAIISQAIADGLASVSRFTVIDFSSGKLERPPDYALSGLVEKRPDRWIVRARLTDARHHTLVWEELYEYELGKEGSNQDIAQMAVNAIVIALQTKLLFPEEERRQQLDPPKDPRAYQLVQEGLKYMRKGRNFPKAESKFREAIRRDPTYASAHANLAFMFIVQFLLSNEADRAEFLEKAFDQAQQAVSLNDKVDLAHVSLCYTYIWRGDYDEALKHARRAVEIVPYGLQSNLALAASLIYSGKPQEGYEAARKAEKVAPSSLSSGYTHVLEGHALVGMGRYEQAVEQYRKAIPLLGNGTAVSARAGLIVAFVRMSREDDAKRVALELKTEDSDVTIDRLMRRMPFRDKQVTESMRRAFEKAGLK